MCGKSVRHDCDMRELKITLGEMRASGPTRLLIYCQDYRCSHSVTIDASQWPDDVRLSDLEPRFTCKACGHRGADVRLLFAVDKPASCALVANDFARVSCFDQMSVTGPARLSHHRPALGFHR
jgi:hypothetical protein